VNSGGRPTSRENFGVVVMLLAPATKAAIRPKSWAKYSFGPWLAAAARRLHRNILTIALANKLAWIALTVLVQGRSYETRITRAAA
jgi:transposase